MDGETIAVGRIESGEVERGMEVTVLPGGQRNTVQEIKKFLQKEIQRASWGESIGVVLDGPNRVKRGDVLSGGGNVRSTKEFDATVIWFEGAYDGQETMKIRCTTQESSCQMIIQEKFDPGTLDRTLEETNRLEIGEVAKVKIKTEEALVLDSFSYIPEMGRFVIEKHGIPVGGGIVV